MLTEIRTRIAQQLNIPVDSITADSKLVDDLKADSLDIVELVTSLEEEYNIEISDEDIKNIRTVGDVVRFIESNNLNRTEDGLERQLNFGGFHPNPNAPDNPFSVRFFAAPRFAGGRISACEI